MAKKRKSVVEKATTYTTKKDMIKLARLILEKLDIKMYKTQLYFRQDNRHTHNNRLLLQCINEGQKLPLRQTSEKWSDKWKSRN